MAAACGNAGGGQGDARVATALQPSPFLFDKLTKYDQERLTTLLTGPMAYMHHPCFRNPGTARRLFGDCHDLRGLVRPWCNSAGGRALQGDSYLAATHTLNTQEEQRLFLRLNYARFRIAQLQVAFAGKRLTGKAAKELLWWHDQAVAVRAEIVQANLPLVLAMAKRTRLAGADYTELISEGNMALLRSVDKFDCGRGFKFSTYACRAILKSFSRVAMRAARYRGRFPAEFDPNLEKSDYAEVLRQYHQASCVDELLGIIRTNSAALNDVEVKVLRARFALDAADSACPVGPQTLEEVGLLIGVTKERVRQIQNRALSKLREKLQEFLAA